jgi:hypothetical protein
MKMDKRAILTAGSALAGALALGTLAAPAAAQERYSFRFADHSVGRTVSRVAPPLRVTLEIRRTGLRISGADRSEICASFENVTQYDWSGGYRLTDREVRDTHASLSVPAYETVRRCETLSPQMVYYVILRGD